MTKKIYVCNFIVVHKGFHHGPSWYSVMHDRFSISKKAFLHVCLGLNDLYVQVQV